MNPRCRICGKEYRFPDCELEARIYSKPGGALTADWAKSPGGDDREKFANWVIGRFEESISTGQEPGELGLDLVLLGRKEGLRALVPLLSGTTQQKWDFIVKRLFPLSFSLTHARPGGYETERLQRWVDQNFDRLRWSDEKRAFVLG